jgi:hypothetical protein
MSTIMVMDTATNDTAGQEERVAAKTLTAPRQGVPVLPILFTAGMTLVDTIDGIVMHHAYSWAFAAWSCKTTDLRTAHSCCSRDKCPQRLFCGMRHGAHPPALWAGLAAAWREDDALHRRRGIPKGLCFSGAGAKIAFENPVHFIEGAEVLIWTTGAMQ